MTLNVREEITQSESIQNHNMEGHCKYLNEIVQPRQRDASFKKDKPAGCSSKARRTDPADGGILQGLPGPSLLFCCVYFHPAVQDEVKNKLEENDKFQKTVEDGIQELKSKGEER